MSTDPNVEDGGVAVSGDVSSHTMAGRDMTVLLNKIGADEGTNGLVVAAFAELSTQIKELRATLHDGIADEVRRLAAVVDTLSDHPVVCPFLEERDQHAIRLRQARDVAQTGSLVIIAIALVALLAIRCTPAIANTPLPPPTPVPTRTPDLTICHGVALYNISLRDGVGSYRVKGMIARGQPVLVYIGLDYYRARYGGTQLWATVQHYRPLVPYRNEGFALVHDGRRWYIAPDDWDCLAGAFGEDMPPIPTAAPTQTPYPTITPQGG